MPVRAGPADQFPGRGCAAQQHRFEVTGPGGGPARARAGARVRALVRAGEQGAAAGPGRWRRGRSRSLPGPPRPAGPAITGSVPATSERTSTWMPAMCVAGRQSSHRSPGAARTRASDARAECVRADALSSTPLGCPVEPDVAITTAVCSLTGIRPPARPAAETARGLHGGRAERVQDAGEPLRRKAGLQREDRRPAAVQGRREPFQQPPARRRGEDNRMQRTFYHARKVRSCWNGPGLPVTAIPVSGTTR